MLSGKKIIVNRHPITIIKDTGVKLLGFEDCCYILFMILVKPYTINPKEAPNDEFQDDGKCGGL